jgi:hypothetical protein
VPLTIASGIAVGFLVRQVHAGRAAPIDALAADARARELLLAWAQPAAMLAAGLVVAGLLGWLVARPALPRRASRGAAAAFVGLAAASANLVVLVPMLRSDAPTVTERQAMIKVHEDLEHPPITKALFDAGAYLRANAAPTDIVATNRVFNGTTKAGGQDNRDFAVPAVSGLRADVAGFGYAPRMLDRPRDGIAYMLAPFWDPPRLAAEQALITDPTPATLAAAHEEGGIRWILADERSGPVSPLLDSLTDPVIVADGVHLYRVRPPQG